MRVKLVGLFSSKWNDRFYIEGMGILCDIPKRDWQIFWSWRRHPWDSESCTIKKFLAKASNFFCTPTTCLWSRGTASTFQFTIRKYLYIFQHQNQIQAMPNHVYWNYCHKLFRNFLNHAKMNCKIKVTPDIPPNMVWFTLTATKINFLKIICAVLLHVVSALYCSFLHKTLIKPVFVWTFQFYFTNSVCVLVIPEPKSLPLPQPVAVVTQQGWAINLLCWYWINHVMIVSNQKDHEL